MSPQLSVKNILMFFLCTAKSLETLARVARLYVAWQRTQWKLMIVCTENNLYELVLQINTSNSTVNLVDFIPSDQQGQNTFRKKRNFLQTSFLRPLHFTAVAVLPKRHALLTRFGIQIRSSATLEKKNQLTELC